MATSLDQVFVRQCGCQECQSAVSPLSYLSDLLNFATGSLKTTTGGGSPIPITLDFFEDTFYQKFGALPFMCDQAERKVCQIRTAIEVLRNYLSDPSNVVPEDTLEADTEEYCFQVYNDLLIQLGTTYEEIRLIQGATEANKQKLANKLGIVLSDTNNTLEKLYLSETDNTLTEEKIEELFGIVNSTRDPFSDACKIGDSGGLITRWNLEGVKWGINTDTNGYIYVKLLNASPYVRLYTHTDRTSDYLVASGVSFDTTNKIIVLGQENNSMLSGYFELTSFTDNSAISMSAVSLYMSWQMAKLREDWSAAQYEKVENEESELIYLDKTPLIDPDLIGPDDLLVPYYDVAKTETAIYLWQTRYEDLNEKYDAIKDERENNSNQTTPISIDLNIPKGLTIDQNNVKYITNSGATTNIIYKNAAGTTSDWGADGTGTDDFKNPEGIFANTESTDTFLYVADTGNHRIKKIKNSDDLIPTVWTLGGTSSGSNYGQFSSPKDLVIASDNSLYVADYGNDRIQVINLSYLNSTIDTSGGETGVGSLSSPADVKTDKYGNIYVADTNNHRVKVCKPSGEKLFLLGKTDNTSGTADGQFNKPGGVALDNEGFLYVADTENHRIQKFTDKGVFVTSWGESGSGDGQFNKPQALCCHKTTAGLMQVYVADTYNDRVQVFDTEGNLLFNFGTFGTADGQMKKPFSVAVDSKDEIVVSDAQNNRIQKFSGTGTYLNKVIDYSFEGTTFTFTPVGVFIDEDDFVYVTIIGGTVGTNTIPRIVKFQTNSDSTLTVDLHWGGTSFVLCGNMIEPAGIQYNSDGTIIFADKSSSSNKLIRLALPRLISVTDPSGLVYSAFDNTLLVVSAGNTVQKRSLDGSILLSWTVASGGLYKITVDDAGFVYVSQNVTGHKKVLKYWLQNDSATLVATYSSLASTALVGPLALATDENRQMFVTDSDAGSINKVYSFNGINGAGFALIEGLGISVSQLQQYRITQSTGGNISVELESLGLTSKGLNYLFTVLDMAERNQDIRPEEWDAFYNIMVQAYKLKNFYLESAEEESTGWKRLEEDAGIILSSDYFRLRNETEEAMVVLPSWRATTKQRRNWVKRLQGTITQEKNVSKDFYGYVDSTQDKFDPVLRDILIKASEIGEEGATFEEKADLLSKRLLIDMKNNCCQTTTRVASAFEVLQGILTSVRTGQLASTFPTVSLNYSGTDAFDKKWEWMGSYEKWRAGMFVHLYPENILLPQYKPHKTPVFAQLIRESYNAPRFTPEDAKSFTKRYTDYAKDVSDIVVDASCIVTNGTDQLFLFGQGKATGKVYFSTYDISATDKDYAQSAWAEIPGTVSMVSSVIGCDVFRNRKAERHVYVYMRVKSGLTTKLGLQRFNLETLKWDDEYTEIDKNIGSAEIKVLQHIRVDDLETGPSRLIGLAPDGSLLQVELNEDGTDLGDKKNVVFEVETPTTIAKDAMDKIADKFASKRPRAEKFLNRSNIQTSYGVAQAGAQISDLKPMIVDELYDYIRVIDKPTFLGKVRNIPIDVIICSYSGRPFVVLTYPQVPGSSARFPLNQMPSKVEFLGAYNRPSIEGESTTKIDTYWRDMNSAEILRKTLRLLPDTYAISNPNVNSYNPYVVEQWKPESSSFPVPMNFGVKKPYRYAMPDMESFAVILNNKLTNFSISETGIYSYSLPVPLYPIDSIGGITSLASSTDTYSISSGDLFTSGTVVRGRSDENMSQISTAIAPQIPVISNIADIENGSPDSLRNASQFLLQNMNSTNSKRNRNYFEELYYFVPVYMALQLQQRGFYKEALDWYRKVYNYTSPEGNRKIYYGLIAEESLENKVEGSKSWLSDPTNPHSAAVQRKDTYTRFTLLSITRCLIEYGDSEYSLDNAESLPRGRRLYESAIELLQSDELTDNTEESCTEKLRELDELDSDFNDYWLPLWYKVKQDAAHISSILVLNILVDDTIPDIFLLHTEQEDRIAYSAYAVTLELEKQKVVKEYSTIQNLREERIKLSHRIALGDNAVYNAVLNVVNTAASRFASNIVSTTGILPSALTVSTNSMEWIRQPVAIAPGPVNFSTSLSLSTVLEVDSSDFEANFVSINTLNNNAPLRTAVATRAMLDNPQNLSFHLSAQRSPQVTETETLVTHYAYCVPANPVRFFYMLHAQANLFKMRNCMNIAGIKREIDPYAAPIDSTSGMPFIAIGGQIQFAGTPKYNPGIYRYDVLIERAKQLANLASQMESAMLSSIEKRDAEAYSRLKAQQDLKLSRQNIKLSSLRTRAAQDEVKLAELQKEKAEFTEDHFDDLVNEGLSTLEYSTIAAYAASVVFYGIAATDKGLKSALSLGTAESSAGTTAQLFSTTASLLSQQASFERRAEEWRFQRDLARWDTKIGSQQVKIANDRLRVAGQEERISEMQSDFAEDTLNFLETKFTNAELYDWMGNQLGNVYRTFLQLATATARSAQDQLAFERHGPTLDYVKTDYWSSPQDLVDGSNTDRQGLTGSAKLLQDIYLLDQYAFTSDKRKNELTKTISLAQLDPNSFQQFKETGVLRFTTSLDMFNRDFPGQYLRLIKKVKTSVIALIPPTQGIKATLTSSGQTQVEAQVNETIQIQNLNRPPESVQLTGAIDATGMFEMQSVNTKLNPFEGNGVAGSWTFVMPKPANLFDFNSIADVQLTMEYTSLDDATYRQQKIKQLNDAAEFDNVIMYSFRNDFADQWYELCNKTNTAEDCEVSFTTQAADLPANLNNPLINGVSIYFSRKDGYTEEIMAGLSYVPDTGDSFTGKMLPSRQGLLSTTSGSAAAWSSINNSNGRVVSGEWTLSLLDTLAFNQEEIEDIIFAVYYNAETSKWPV